MIPSKLFLKLMDMEISARENKSYLLVEQFMNDIGWPWKASQEQLTYWNNFMEVFCK